MKNSTVQRNKNGKSNTIIRVVTWIMLVMFVGGLFFSMVK